MQKRLESLRALLRERGLDALITGKAVNRRYISGFTGSAGYVIVSLDQAVLITDFRYVDQAAREAPAFTVVNSNRKEKETILEQLRSMGVKRLGFEQSAVSFATYAGWREAFSEVELVPVEGVIEQLRAVKDEGEIALIRKAVQIVDDTFAHILSCIKPGVRETDIALEIEFFMRKQGAEASAFDIIVASGERGALPHGRASEKEIRQGELVTLDFGAVYQGYASDITRTVAVGQPHPRLQEIYEIVRKAQLAGVSNIKAGMSGKEADALTREVIAAAGYADAFGHSTGHGLGLDVHESPALSAASDTLLAPGMVVTVEPGIYLSGLGGVRIEDDVLITQDGCEILTQSTKELLILPV